MSLKLLCKIGWHHLAPFSAWKHWEDDEPPPWRWCTRCDHLRYTYGPVTVTERIIKIERIE